MSAIAEATSLGTRTSNHESASHQAIAVVDHHEVAQPA